MTRSHDRIATHRLDLTPRLSSLRRALHVQRDFRIEQLAQLEAARLGAVQRKGAQREVAQSIPRPTATDPSRTDAESAARALLEVEEIVTAGARRALADIELSLRRMETGVYGECHMCGEAIDIGVLTAVPMTTTCLACLRHDGDTTRVPDRAATDVRPTDSDRPRGLPAPCPRASSTRCGHANRRQSAPRMPCPGGRLSWVPSTMRARPAGRAPPSRRAVAPRVDQAGLSGSPHGAEDDSLQSSCHLGRVRARSMRRSSSRCSALSRARI